MTPIRVLHVLGAMNRGGVETWLMHVLRHLDRASISTDLLVHTDQPAAYDNDVLALGSRILRCPHTRNPLLYATRFLQLIRRHGPYDVVHSHVHHFSGFILGLARIIGIPVRIAHSHNDTTTLDRGANLARAVYLKSFRRLISANCTQGIAVSTPAAAALFGPNWRNDRRFQVVYCGIDPAPFHEQSRRAVVRAEFGFSNEDVVFGHVGRFDPQKNHEFLLETAAEVRKLEPRAKYLLVGDGPLRPAMEARARALGLQECTVFAGVRPDVPRLMTAGMDLLLFPSLHEGLPIVLLEAQAAGLPALVSEGIPQEALIYPPLIRYLPLSAGPPQWAKAACEMTKLLRLAPPRALELFRASPFGIDRCIHNLSSLYRTTWGTSQEASVEKRMAV